MDRFVISRVHPIEEVDINLLHPTTPVEEMEYSQLYMGKKPLSMPEMHIQIVISELRQSDNGWRHSPVVDPNLDEWGAVRNWMLPAAEKGSVVWSPTVTAILVYDAMLSHKFSVLMERFTENTQL